MLFRTLLPGLAGLAGIIVLLLLSLANEYQNADQQAQMEVENISRMLEEHALSTVQKSDLLLRDVLGDVHPGDMRLARGSDSRRAKELHALLKSHIITVPELSVLHLTDAKGEHIHSSLDQLPHIDISDRPHFRRQRDETDAGLVISSPVISRTTGKWTLVLTRRINFEDGSFAGTITGILEPEYFQKFYLSLNMGMHGVVSLFDKEMNLVARFPPSKKDMGKPTSLYAKIYIEKGINHATYKIKSPLDGIERMYGFRQVGDLPLYVFAGLASDDYLAVWRRHVWEYGVGVLILSFVVSGFALRQQRAEVELRESETRFRALADNAPALIWMSGVDKLCNYFNKGWLDFTGRTMRQELGNGWAEGVHPEDMQRCLGTYVDSFDARQEFYLDYRLRRNDGTYRWIVDHGVPRYDEQGTFHGYIGSCIDIEESKQAAQHVKDNEALLSFALEGAGDGVWDWNVLTGEVVLSEVGATMFGYAQGEASRNIADWYARILPDDQLRWQDMLRNFFREKDEKFSIEYRVRNKKGDYVWVLTRGMVVSRSGEGKVSRMVGVHSDVTQRKQDEEALRKSTEELEDLYNHAPCGYHSLDKDGLIVRINDTELSWLGYTRDEVLGKMKLPDLLTPESLKNFQKTFSFVKKRGVLHDFEIGLVRKDGTVLYGLVNSTIVYDANGEYLMSRSTLFDITERKKTEGTLRSLFTAIEHSPIGVVITDADANIQYVSPRFSTITGYNAGDMVGRNLRLFQIAQIAKDIYLEMWNALSGGQSWHGELSNKRKRGQVYWEDVNITPVIRPDGSVANYAVVVADISERKVAEERMRHLAHYDSLTDLPNRSLVDDRMSQALAAAKRDKTRMALMFLDLDKFKPINDTLGHDVGDLLLKEAAIRMQGCVRESDTVGRIGGDEFVVLLPTVDSGEHAMRVAEKIRHALNQTFVLSGHDLNISSSIGLAVYPEHGDESKALVKNADTAMYYAKEGGRNNVRLFKPEMLVGENAEKGEGSG